MESASEKKLPKVRWGVFVHRAISGIALSVWGDGAFARDYIHVVDVAEAFVQAIDYLGPRRVFNVSTGLGVSLNNLIRMLEGILGKATECNYLPCRPFEVPVNGLCNKSAQEELNLAP